MAPRDGEVTPLDGRSGQTRASRRGHGGRTARGFPASARAGALLTSRFQRNRGASTASDPRDPGPPEGLQLEQTAPPSSRPRDLRSTPLRPPRRDSGLTWRRWSHRSGTAQPPTWGRPLTPLAPVLTCPTHCRPSSSGLKVKLFSRFPCALRSVTVIPTSRSSSRLAVTASMKVLPLRGHQESRWL